jgi:hypothetical protein
MLTFCLFVFGIRVASLVYIFKPKIPIWAKKDVGKFHAPLVYFTAIWNILWPFGIFCGHLGKFVPVLVCCTKKYLATLFGMSRF